MSRPRATVATLLAATAMIAVDLWWLRRLMIDESVFGPKGEIRDSVPWIALDIGMLPMFNLWGMSLLGLVTRGRGGRALLQLPGLGERGGR